MCVLLANLSMYKKIFYGKQQMLQTNNMVIFVSEVVTLYASLRIVLKKIIVVTTSAAKEWQHLPR